MAIRVLSPTVTITADGCVLKLHTFAVENVDEPLRDLARDAERRDAFRRGGTKAMISRLRGRPLL